MKRRFVNLPSSQFQISGWWCVLSYLAEITSSTDQITILGDLGLSDVDWDLKSSKTASIKFIELFNSLGFEQLVRSPTLHATALEVILSSADFITVNVLLLL